MDNLTNKNLASSRASGPTCIGFLLLHNYTMMSLASAVEPLRMANQLSNKELYQWVLITEDGAIVAASDGIRAQPDASISDAPKLDALFVVGGIDISHSYTCGQLDWLRKLDKSGVQLGGICTGAMALAEAHLLDGQECSMHWENMVSMQELYPQVECNNHLFTVTSRRITCSGGTAPLDMMLNIIGKAHGKTLAQGISEMFILDRIRDQTDNQKVPLRYTMGVAPPKLIEATTLMEANIEEPLTLIELAQLLGISRRQMERLFKINLDCAPSKYYLLLRLHRARRLLKQTSLSIIDISSSCGFVSRPHFSRCYATHMGLTPRGERASMNIENDSSDSDYTDFELEDPALYEPHYGRVTVVPTA
ncbi:MAG: transcriptional regulator GlxA family with amidase domain [Halioglobus sp.]|jgi:transcriptional regulator GlxA family with amidase domain